MKRLPKAQQTNKDKPRRRENIFNICFLRFQKNVGSHPKKNSFSFGLTQQHLHILCYCDCEYVTKWTHKKMHKIIDDKILGSMNALMSFNILSVAILAKSANIRPPNHHQGTTPYGTHCSNFASCGQFLVASHISEQVFLLSNSHISDFHSVNIVRFNLETKSRNMRLPFVLVLAALFLHKCCQ